MNSASSPATPTRAALARELRMLVEAPRMLATLASLRVRTPSGRRPSRVVLVPGFGGTEAWMRPLSRYLEHHGHETLDWGMGRNLGGLDLPHSVEKLSDRWPVEPRREYRDESSVPYLCDRFGERMLELSGGGEDPVTLIGWSLGGYVCREAARDNPAAIRRVITLGSPVLGGPKYTATARYFAKRGNDLDWMEGVIADRERYPIEVPITAIYSRSDGVVDWRAMRDESSPDVRHVETPSSHLGMVINPTVWRHVRAALESPESSRSVN